MSALRERVAGLDHGRLDVLLAGAIILVLELECWLDRGIPASHRTLTAIAIVVFAAPVAVRRRWPAAIILSAAAATLQALLGGRLSSTDGVGMLAALATLAYSTGALLELRRALLALVLSAVAFSGFVIQAEPTLPGALGSGVFVLVVVFLAPWSVGRLVRERTRRAAAFRQLAARSADEQQERERAAIAEERLRIGRELQDIIAHSVSAMVIQTGGARQLLHSNPGLARDALHTVERTGRQTLADLRRLLGMLRKDEDPRALAPQPGLDQLASLIRSVDESGVDCEFQTSGTQIDLTPGLDLLSYRAVEAALYSAARHGTSRAEVTVHYAPHRLLIEVGGDGSRADVNVELRDLHDRVRLYGGSIESPTVGVSGFSLRITLPFASTIAA